MNFVEFRKQLIFALPKGKVLKNPGKGISIIKSISTDGIYYIRGNSTFHISINEIYEAYKRFQGKNVSSTQLKELKPYVYDSSINGHSCNCTFLFLILKEMGIVDTINGKGVKGDPFYVEIK